MKKIEIFTDPKTSGLQLQIQIWLNENPKAFIEELKYNSTSVLYGGTVYYEYSVLIFYIIRDGQREFAGKSFNRDPE